MAEEKKEKTTKKKNTEKLKEEPTAMKETVKEPNEPEVEEVTQEEATTEEKEDTSETTSEEVTVSKKFCTNCGKELNEGEECTCTANKPQENVSININTEAISKRAKNFFDTILNMYKKPATTIDNEVAKKDTTGNIIMLVVIALTYGLSVIAMLPIFLNLIDGINLNEVVEVPYFKIFLCMTLINFITSFIPVIVAFITNKICDKRNLNFKQALSLYATSYAPTVITNLIMALMYYLNILSWVGAIIGSIVEVICFFNFCLGYVRVSKPSEDKKSLIVSGIVLVWFVASFLINIFFISNILTDTLRDVKIKQPTDSYYDLFS